VKKEDLINTRKSILLFTDIGEDGTLTIKPEIMQLIDGDETLHKYLLSVIKTIPPFDNPTKIEDFNYEYVNGKLQNKDTGNPFHWVNQAHYDALGDTIVKHIQNLMVTDYNLEEVYLPLDADYSGPKNNIFMSKDVLTCSRLMLLIQGAGAVRAGQWARALCINENLSIGTIFPYLEKCKEHSFGVIVFNPNLNDVPVKEEEIKRRSFLTMEKVFKPRVETVKITGSENYRRHGEYIWDNFVRKSSASVIAIVAHSRGGDNTVQLVGSRTEEFNRLVAGIAFTDSVHSLCSRDEDFVINFVKTRACNWVTSNSPLGQIVGEPKYDCVRVSAGHNQHEYTSGAAIEGVFKFLIEKVESFPTK